MAAVSGIALLWTFFVFATAGIGLASAALASLGADQGRRAVWRLGMLGNACSLAILAAVALYSVLAGH